MNSWSFKKGINEAFNNTALSLYRSSKLASEIIILEYASSFDFPVWINRCGVLAREGQFGKPDRGIFPAGSTPSSRNHLSILGSEERVFDEDVFIQKT